MHVSILQLEAHGETYNKDRWFFAISQGSVEDKLTYKYRHKKMSLCLSFLYNVEVALASV